MTQVPLAPPPPSKDPIQDRWLYLLWKRASSAGQLLWSYLDFTGSNLTNIETRNYKDLQNIPARPVFFMPEDHDDEQLIPGPRGRDGINGISGPRGSDGEDGEDGLTIPGQRGNTGATGPTGSRGAVGVGLDGEDGQDGMPIPGGRGVQGVQGVPGATGPAVFLESEAGEDGMMGPPGPAGASGTGGGVSAWVLPFAAAHG